MSKTRGIFALDPGGASGTAWGIFPLGGSLANSLQKRMYAGSETVNGDEYEQIREISRLWRRFYHEAVHKGLLDPEDVEFVCEDFIPNLEGRTGKEIVSPIRIMWGVEGYRLGRADEWMSGRHKDAKKVYCPPMILQVAGQASTFATGPRLRQWDLWVRGREHERSAWKHVALRLATILKQR